MDRIAIVGAGGIGSVTAGFLARAGVPVLLVGRSPDHIETIQRRGLRLDLPDGTSETIDLEATVETSGYGTAKHVVVATKAFDTESAAERAAPLVGPTSWVTTIQTGLDNDAILARSFGASRVLPGLTTIGGERRSPGSVFVIPLTVEGKSRTYIGAPRTADGALDGANSLKAAMDGAGLPVVATDEIDRAIWMKLSMAPIGLVCALIGATVAEAWRDAGIRELARALHDEVVQIASSRSVALSRDENWKMAVAAFEQTGEHYPSMASDLISGRRTEIDSTFGAVLRIADQGGLPAPLLSVVVRLVRAAETRRRAQRNS